MAAVALTTGMAAMAPGATAPSQAASVLALVPGSQLGASTGTDVSVQR
jgi:hypothetical protein